MLVSSSRSFSMVNDTDYYLSLQAPKERGVGHVQAVSVLIVERVGSAKTRIWRPRKKKSSLVKIENALDCRLMWLVKIQLMYL